MDCSVAMGTSQCCGFAAGNATRGDPARFFCPSRPFAAGRGVRAAGLGVESAEIAVPAQRIRSFPHPSKGNSAPLKAVGVSRHYKQRMRLVCAAPFLVGHRPLFALRLSPAARERPEQTLMANTRPARMRGSAEPAARRQRRAALGLLLPNPRRGHGREKSLKSLTGAGGLGERNVISGPASPAFGSSGRLSPQRTEESVAFGGTIRPSLAAPFPAANGRCDADPWGRDNRKRGFERAEARQERFSGTRFPSRSPLRVSRLDGSRLPYF